VGGKRSGGSKLTYSGSQALLAIALRAPSPHLRCRVGHMAACGCGKTAEDVITILKNKTPCNKAAGGFLF